MIPVTLQPEPPDFDEKVRQKGRAWLKKNNISFDVPPPPGTELYPYWRASNKQLWCAYSGVCAYLAIYFEFATGAATTDHYVAKSSENAGNAYEWENFRLACFAMNRNKNKFNDVFDPVMLEANTFLINFSSGEIYPNPKFSKEKREAAQRTIDRLQLNSFENKRTRTTPYTDYLNGDCSLDYLSKNFPFAHAEIVRQGL